MIHYVISIRDIIANVWHPPMFVPNLGAAVRSFGDACQDNPKGNVIAQHPEDYELWHRAFWDDGDCTFHTDLDPMNPGTTFKPNQIAVGSNYKTR